MRHGLPHTCSSRLLILAAAVIALLPCAAAQEDGGVSYDNRGQELLESVFVPSTAHAPFSLTLATEWSRPMSNGGTYTVVNARPIKRDAEGRIYEERWLLAPKGTRIQSRMSWIQIADPVAQTLLECNAHEHVCELEDWRIGAQLPANRRMRSPASSQADAAHTTTKTSDRSSSPGSRFTPIVRPQPLTQESWETTGL